MIKKYYQSVDLPNNKITVLDFDKIRENDCHINIIMSERGTQGKTFNLKEHILKRFLEHGEKALWIVNTQDQLRTMANRFLTNHTNPLWNQFKITQAGLTHIETKEIVLYFASITTFHNHKGGRDNKIKTVAYDEFNEHIGYVWSKQIPAFESLLHTYGDPTEKGPSKQRIFLIANTKSLAVPILDQLGLKTLDNEEQFLTFETLKIWVYVPVKDAIELQQLSKKWLFSLSKLFQLHEANFLNRPEADNFEGVDIKEDLFDFSYRTKYFVALFYSFYEVYYSQLHKNIYINKIEKLPKNLRHKVFWIAKADKEFGRSRYYKFDDDLNYFLENRRIIFCDLMTKYDFLAINNEKFRDSV